MKRRDRSPSVGSVVVTGAAVIGASAAHAVIFFSTSDPNFNTEPPADELAGRGWELQGSWSFFLGTPIGPRHFITAKHLGGVVGDKFSLNGIEYTTAAFFDDPDSDLRIWRIRESFPSYAQLYPRTDELGKDLVVFGRGTQRGDEVTVSSLFGGVAKGWLWGLADGRKRWGENQVGEVVSNGSNPRVRGGLLRAPFNSDAGPNEAHLSAGDSGGGLFVKDGPTWKLAGVNFTVDGPYNTNETGAGFLAAIFDEGGLYKGGEGNWTRVSESVACVPGGFSATRLSVRLHWTNGVLAQPPTHPSCPSVLAWRQWRYTMKQAHHQPGDEGDYVAQPLTAYRLAPTASRIAEIKVQAGMVCATNMEATTRVPY